MRLSRKTALFATVFAAFVTVALMAQTQGQGQGQGQAGQTPPPGPGRGQAGSPQNLQVLPKDLTFQQVQQQMRTFAAALGVQCTHCHVGTMAERSKDDNPKKGIARQMLKMTMAINNDLLKDVGEPAPDGAAKVTCFTCHRGAIKPLTAPGAGGGH